MCGGEEKESNLTRTLNPLGETKCSGWSGFTVRASVDRVFGYDWIWCSRWGGFYTSRDDYIILCQFTTIELDYSLQLAAG